MQEYFSNLVVQFVATIPSILTALFIFAASLYFARLLGNLLKRVLLRRNTDSGVTYLLSDILRWTIVVFGVITAVQIFFDVTAFLAGLGIIGFTVGFALQNVMQNFVSGIILLVQQPFKVTDEINVLNFDGIVLQINLRTTELQTLDGRIVILPNADVISHAIVNYTRAHRRRVDVLLSVSSKASPEMVRALLADIVKDVPGYVMAPAPEIVFSAIGNSSMELTVSFWVDASLVKVDVAKDSALLKVKESFASQKIEMSLPSQMIYLENKE